MSDQTRSQLLGVALAVFTAVGCIAYEKLVKAHRLSTILLLGAVFYLPGFLIYLTTQREETVADLTHVVRERPGAMLCYLAAWVTTPLWYFITRKQGVMVSSAYEVKYIVILVVGYALFGDQRLSGWMVLSIACALTSVYAASRS